jgi:Phosphotransferase enzyme family
LHRVDPRFVLSHEVRRAVVLDGLDEWRAGLASAGIEVADRPNRDAPDLIVSSVRLAGAAVATSAKSVIVEGIAERPFRSGEYRPRRLLLRPTRERPTLALPLDQPVPASYALQTWSVVDRRWKSARMHAARALVARGRFPSWASPITTVATRVAGPPRLVAAARDLGVPDDACWFLTFGQGDALSRNAFHLFRPASDRPEWILKFARVTGYSERFTDDERGLALALAAGGAVAEHVPSLLGRLEVDGVHASLETAAAGRRLRDVLSEPGGRCDKLRLVDRIAGWVLELDRLSRRPPVALSAELERLRSEVAPRWADRGAAELVDELPALPAVLQHNDLGSWNVVAQGDDFRVVDWEDARDAGLPLWDLLYFLADALVQLDGPAAPEDLPARMSRLFAGEARSSPFLFAWIRKATDSMAVPPDAVATIATLCWLSHSLSAGRHDADLATYAPRHPARIHGFEGMARAWMEHPALGVGWSAWRN